MLGGISKCDVFPAIGLYYKVATALNIKHPPKCFLLCALLHFIDVVSLFV